MMITNYQQYLRALEAIDKLWDAEPNTIEATNLDILVSAVEDYEREQGWNLD